MEVWPGVEVDLDLDIIKVEDGVEVDELLVPTEYDQDYVWTEPIRPSTCGSGVGLDGSLVGLVLLGISSYKVPDWE